MFRGINPLIFLTLAACEDPPKVRAGAPPAPSASPPTLASTVPRVPEPNCEKLAGCREVGECVEVKGTCAPTRAEHCERSKACLEGGACKLLDPRLAQSCGADSHADCAATAVCREQKKCWRMETNNDNGRCIQATLRVSARFALNEGRHGVSGELVLRTDSRFPKIADPAGYWPSEDEPRADAVLEIRTADGATSGETELFPAIEVLKRDLGAGTDSFFVTAQLRCAAGRWCGWRTVVFEVRNGRLTEVQALGNDGKETPFEMMASQGARWKIASSKTPGKRDVVSQGEHPPPGPDLTETRFFFQEARWHVTEREFEDPHILKQPGEWHGTLAFHE